MVIKSILNVMFKIIFFLLLILNISFFGDINKIKKDLATEIILTLGQAFEVAYQIALRKSTPTTPIRSPVNSSLQVKQ